MNGNGVGNRKSINKLHFIYSVCILSGAILLLLATILLDYTKTVETLSISGILLSIVLAIVAILITLWDVAGQKNALGDIREQINSIKEITDDIRESAESSKELVGELQDFDSRFRVNFDPIRDILDTISDKIDSQSDSVEFDSIKTSVEELKTIVSEKETDLTHMKKSISTKKERMPYETLIDRAVKYINEIETGKSFIRRKLVTSILKDVPYTTVGKNDLDKLLSILIASGVIEFIGENKYTKN